MSRKFRVTLIHPCIGRRAGEKYLRTWQMEPLPCAVLAGLTPGDVELTFWDDRMERIPYDAPTDLVAISVETYTARRAYQIASEYRARAVPVVMGGFHATLCTDEVCRYADSVVVGEAEELWPEVLDDYRLGRGKKIYRAGCRPALAGSTPDRTIYGRRRYLPLALVEVGRGCKFGCEFCSIQTMFQRSYSRRPTAEVVREIKALRGRGRGRGPLFFFVDDNFIASPEQAKEVLRALIPLKIRWVSQASINVAHDPQLLRLLKRSGCAGLLIGFESLNPDNLALMNKGINGRGFEPALANLRRHRIPLYGTFLFGYGHDTERSFTETLTFARRHAFYIAAFNHVTPFPGTALYARLQREGRLLYDSWWLDPSYSYNQIPFTPAGMDPQTLHRCCVAARREFYSLGSIARRGLDRVNRANLSMLRAFYPLNLLHRTEVSVRDAFPLGDQAHSVHLLEAA